MAERKPTTGPRGGTTTTSKGQVKKSFWINTDEAEALRLASFKRRVSEAELVRDALRRYFKLAD